MDSQFNFPNTPTMVMFSGGIDSTVLLNLVHREVKDKVAAGYMDFGQESASRQRAYVQRTCNSLGIPLHVLDAPRLVTSVLGTEGPPHIMQTEHSLGGDVHVMASVGSGSIDDIHRHPIGLQTYLSRTHQVRFRQVAWY